jgi:hypothetical protein
MTFLGWKISTALHWAVDRCCALLLLRPLQACTTPPDCTANAPGRATAWGVMPPSWDEVSGDFFLAGAAALDAAAAGRALGSSWNTWGRRMGGAGGGHDGSR